MKPAEWNVKMQMRSTFFLMADLTENNLKVKKEPYLFCLGRSKLNLGENGYKEFTIEEMLIQTWNYDASQKVMGSNPQAGKEFFLH